MSIPRMIVATVLATAGFFYIVLAYLMIGWGWSDGVTHWTPFDWAVNIIPWSIPYLVLLLIIYKCVGSNLKYTVIAEALGLSMGLLLVIGSFLVACARAYLFK